MPEKYQGEPEDNKGHKKHLEKLKIDKDRAVWVVKAMLAQMDVDAKVKKDKEKKIKKIERKNQRKHEKLSKLAIPSKK